MRQAWNWALSSIERGLSGRAGLRQYRAGGGAIRDSDWFYLRRAGAKAYDSYGKAGETWPTLPVPPRTFTEADWDYREEYVTTAQVRYFDPVEESFKNAMITVESAGLHTLDEWENDVTDVVIASLGELFVTRPEIQRMWFYRRQT